MATSLADPAAPADEHGAAGPQPDPPAPGAGSTDAQGACARCGSPMSAGQDWCLQCGAGAPGSLGDGTPAWRSGATILAATAVLLLGAGAAAYAALSRGKAPAHVLTSTVAQLAPGAVPPAAATQATPANPGAPTTVAPAVPIKPPKIPLKAVIPGPAGTISVPKPTVTPPVSTTPSTTGGAPAQEGSQPGAILLDTNAAATYNPYAYAAPDFGDPSLTIDGDTSTAWTAQVDPTVAPKMAEGVVIDLKSARRLSALELATSTPGMTIQVYGANVAALPTSITDHAWLKLTPALVEKSKHLRLKLRQPKKAVRFVTLWISMAPAASVGTPQAPGHVSVNELELFPAP